MRGAHLKECSVLIDHETGHTPMHYHDFFDGDKHLKATAEEIAKIEHHFNKLRERIRAAEAVG